jgi:peptide/nickel transport system ATP-binding protein
MVLGTVSTISLDTNDEIGEIAGSFNQISAALQQSRTLKTTVDSENESLQAGIFDLLQVVSRAADGELTVRASVNEGAIGNVADAFNQMMESMQKLLGQISLQLDDTLRAHGVTDRAALDSRGRALMALVDLQPEHLGRYPHELSGGMRQRACIAFALALQPQLVIMDEPTTALDVVVQRDILQRVLELQARLGFAVLFISHDLPLMLELVDRVAVLYAGRLCELSPTAALQRGALHPYARGLLHAFPTLLGPRDAARGIDGAPPSPRSPPPGCRFHPRCGRAAARCGLEAPPWVTWPADPTRQVACHHAGALEGGTP